MELQLCQVAFILTTLFSGFDARAILSRHSEITRPDQSLVQKLETIDVKSEVKQFINKSSDTIDHLGGLGRKHRSRRFAMWRWKWNYLSLDWTISYGTFPSSITRSDFKDMMTKAFRMWSEVSRFIFRYTDRKDQANIEVSFARKYHYCEAGSFDGPGGIIAHASYPKQRSPFKSFIHFDGDEQWTVSDGTSNKYSLLPVALHEVGHVLGLKHSSDRNSVMYEFYNKKSSSIQLDDDDVNGIQRMYGRCYPKSLQAAGVSQYQTYFFQNELMWLYNQGKDRSERGYPRKISTKWSGLPKTIDSMFELNARTYFVAGGKVYRTNLANNGIDPGYPKGMFWQGNGLPFLFRGWLPVQNGPPVHAVSEFDDGYIYIFRGSEVFRVDASYGFIYWGWPKSISQAFGSRFPSKVDSVFYNKNDRYVYIFSDDYYYKYRSVYSYISGARLIGGKFKNLCLV